MEEDPIVRVRGRSMKTIGNSLRRIWI